MKASLARYIKNLKLIANCTTRKKNKRLKKVILADKGCRIFIGKTNIRIFS